MAYWNGTSFVNLSNTLVWSGTGGSVPTTYDEYSTNSIPISAIINNTIKLKLITGGSVRIYQNWLSLALLSATGTIQDVKGSSEMHITNIANATLNLVVNSTNNSAIAQFVWNYSNRSLTYYPDNTNYTKIVEDVWSYASRNLTYFPTQQDLTNYTKVSDFVWNYLNRNLTYYNMTDTTNYTQIINGVWEYMNRSLTDNGNQLIVNATWNYLNRSLTIFSFDVSPWVWNNSNRTLTYYPSQMDLTNYTQIFEGTWNYGNRSLTEFNFIVNATINETELVDLIWSIPNRTLTFYNNTQQLDLTNYTQIFEGVWLYGNRSLTDFGFIVNTSIDISQLVNSVWNASNRTLTFYNNTQQLDLTNYSKINQGVWSYFNRTLQYVSPTGQTENYVGFTKLPLSTISFQLPDPFYFDTDYDIYYDPVNIKGETVEISSFSVKMINNITYNLNTPVLQTDGRYKQTINVPLQDISSFTLDINATQNFITTNQKAYFTPIEKRGGITGFVTMSDTTKRNLLYVFFILLFLLFMIVILAVVNKSKKERGKKYPSY
jgi:hypothetical protein